MSFILPTFILLGTSVGYITYPIVTEAEKGNISYVEEVESPQKSMGDRYVIVRLDTNKLELHDVKSTTTVLELVSQGKPGSYYETIAGTYTSDYKIPLHFSSMGHVYMPYSIHLFGNYFIHGIPYYPDGTKVSSTYSGGCIRLNDIDAKRVYDFITSSTTIIITRESRDEFTPTTTSLNNISSISMTKLMTAIVSLEYLTQDNKINNIGNNSSTTRLELLPTILNNNNTDASIIYKGVLSDKTFIQAMNKRALSLGLTNTTFTDVNTPASTTEEDYNRFMSHILTYKSYLVKATNNSL